MVPSDFAFVIVVWVAFAFAILVIVRWAGGARPLGRWQITLAQVLILLTIAAILGGIFRWWYLNEYLDPVRR